MMPETALAGDTELHLLALETKATPRPAAARAVVATASLVLSLSSSPVAAANTAPTFPLPVGESSAATAALRQFEPVELSLADRYSRLVNSRWFRETYGGRSLGEALALD
jgi:hypothetical protein